MYFNLFYICVYMIQSICACPVAAHCFWVKVKVVCRFFPSKPMTMHLSWFPSLLNVNAHVFSRIQDMTCGETKADSWLNHNWVQRNRGMEIKFKKTWIMIFCVKNDQNWLYNVKYRVFNTLKLLWSLPSPFKGAPFPVVHVLSNAVQRYCP